MCITRTEIGKEISSLIYTIRGRRVMLDFSLAQLYGVETKYVNRAVKRNPDRFPHDFYFALTGEEESNLKCQFGTSSSWGGRRRSRPFGKHNDEIASLFEAIKQLMLPIPAKKKNRIGF